MALSAKARVPVLLTASRIVVMARPFEILEHPADVGFMAYGATLEELFANATLAMFSLACDLETVQETEHHKIEATGEDLESPGSPQYWHLGRGLRHGLGSR